MTPDAGWIAQQLASFQENWGESIWINILSSLLFLALGAAFVLSRELVRKRWTTLNFFLPFKSTRRSIYVSYGLVDPEAGGIWRTVEEGDLSAIHSIVSLLSESYGLDKVKALNDQAADATPDQIQNLVSVSGPLWNRSTELSLGMLGSPVTFNRAECTIIQKKNRSTVAKWSTKYDVPGRPNVCYGIIVAGRIDGSDGTDQYVVVCAGNSSLSTYGSTVFMKQMYRKRKLKKVLKKGGIRSRHKRYGLVLRVEDHSAGDSANQELPLNARHLDVRIEKVLPESSFGDPFVYKF